MYNFVFSIFLLFKGNKSGCAQKLLSENTPGSEYYLQCQSLNLGQLTTEQAPYPLLLSL